MHVFVWKPTVSEVWKGILLYLIVFCFRYDAVYPSVYTVMTLAKSSSAANRPVLNQKMENRCFLMLRDKQMYLCEENVIYGVKKYIAQRMRTVPILCLYLSSTR